ncbi:MAG: hypothetical protein FWB86_05285 [Treponema sp.]|nr:hypothetical protein [Treponema sp.]
MRVTIPENIFDEVRAESQGIRHGSISLIIHFRDSQVQYFKTNREKSNSVTPLDTNTSGELDNTRTYSSNHSKVSKGVKN